MNYKSQAEPRTMIGDTPVFCSFDEIVGIENIVGNPRNPNQHPQEQVEMLAKIIKSTGWRANITISKLSGFVVKGHGRLAAAKMAGFEKVPVEYQDYTSEAEEYADLMADNRLAELSEIDKTLLTDLLQEIDTGEIPLELSGYTEDEIEDLMTSMAFTEEDLTKDEDEIGDDPCQMRITFESARDFKKCEDELRQFFDEKYPELNISVGGGAI